MWTVLRAYGGTSTAIGMRNIWPPDPAIDLAVTIPGLGFASRQIFDVWPQGSAAAEAFENLCTNPPDLFERLGLLPHDGERPPAWRSIALDRVAMEALRRLAALRRTDLTWLLLHSPDKVEHVLWATVQHRPGDPIDEEALLASAEAWEGPTVKPGPWGWGSIAAQYIEVDRWLGAFLASFHFDYVLFVSDHGMARSLDGLPGQHGLGLHESHRGILVIQGRQVRRGADVGVVDLRDFAPTLAYLLDLPVAEDLPGRVVEEAFRRSHLRRNPIRTVPSWE